MKKALIVVAVAVLATSAMAASMQISIGLRETGTTSPIGGNGGSANGIEWVGLDGQTLVLDGTWQKFTFDLDQLPITPFAGASANGILGALADPNQIVTTGTLEHIRLKSDGSVVGAPIELWIDDVNINLDPPGPPPPADTLLTGFEGYTDATEVMFQEPGFSGSTSGNIISDPNDPLYFNQDGVDNTMAHTGTASYRVKYTFKDGDPSRWIRLTTFNTPNLPNPTVRFDQDAIISFWLKGVPEPTSLLMALPALAFLRRR